MDNTQSITILMADDDEDDRLMTKEAFEEARLANELRFVEDGEELMDYLNRRGKFETVTRYDAIIMIRRRHHGRWILGIVLNIVIRRIGEQGLEFVRALLGATVIVDPKTTGSKLMESQHVHHADGRQAGTIQIWPLRHAGTH